MGREETGGGRGGEVFLLREARRQGDERSLAAVLDDPSWCSWVGTLGVETVGLAVAHTEELPDRSRLGIVDGLVVEAGARRSGVGERLLEAVLGWLAGEACTSVDAFALPGNRAAKNLWESAGFKARLLVMNRSG